VPEREGEPLYLDIDDVLELYGAIVGGTIDEAAAQLRNRSGLEGAVARPASHAHYAGADVALQAAVLAHGIAETQPFIDGNKRAALVALLTFLEVNGSRVRATDPELADWIISLSKGVTPEELATRIRAATVAVE